MIFIQRFFTWLLASLLMFPLALLVIVGSFCPIIVYGLDDGGYTTLATFLPFIAILLWHSAIYLVLKTK
jgi:hypothetical protein